MTITVAGPATGVFYADNDFLWLFTVRDSDGELVDITGMAYKFVMKRTADAAEAALSTEVSPQTAVSAGYDTANGVFSIAVTDTDSADLIGTYEYQAQVVDGAGNKSNILAGFFTFKPNIVS